MPDRTICSALLAVAVTLLQAGCTPTLSRPRSQAHLRLMAEGARHHHHGRMSDAAQAYASAARHADRRVDRDEALWRQAQALLRTGRRDSALRILDGLAKERPLSRRTVRALYDASRIRFQEGDHDAGRRGMLQILHHHPQHGLASRALYVLLRDREQNRDPEGALRLLSDLRQRLRWTDLGDDILMARAELLLEQNNTAGAIAALHALVREHPYPHGQRWDDALVRLAELAEESGDPAGAIAYLEQLLSVHETTPAPGSYTLPRLASAQLRIARLHRDQLNDPKAAAAAFRKTYDSFPDSTLRDDALVEWGEMLLDAGDRSGCDVLWQAVSEFDLGRARRRAVERIGRACDSE